MTYAEELACKMWLKAYEKWRARPDRQMHELRPKPPGFDLWHQGDNPLGLALTQAKPASLVPPDWTFGAGPASLPATRHEQPPLL